ncbi:PLDc_N domain-containing protein [Candidatus Gracilibacteria bacterium]|nr:PLDc_N domain-containing protein [Candidatus Gracilibacteria bacterium]
MNKYILGFLTFLCILFGVISHVSASQVVNSDDARQFMTIVKNLVNEGNGNDITKMLSPHAGSGLSQKITDAVEGKQIQFIQEFSGIQEYGSGMYKVTGRYSAKGLNWEASGLSNYYILEIVNDKISIVDTDFYQFMPDIMNSIFNSPILKIFPILIFGLVIFWFWMLIDLSKRQIDNKWLWYCLLFFIPFGSIIYFFTGHKKYPKIEKSQ